MEDNLSEVSAVVEETTKALFEIKVQLARMEKTLEGMPAMAATLEATRDLAREACSLRSRHITDSIKSRTVKSGYGVQSVDQLLL